MLTYVNHGVWQHQMSENVQVTNSLLLTNKKSENCHRDYYGQHRKLWEKQIRSKKNKFPSS